MSFYLNQYTPLAASNEGLKAILSKNLKPFLDASCRREPDFESIYPSICASCRGRNFAPRLREGDIIAYSTKNFSWPRNQEPKRKLVAILKVIKSFLTTESDFGLSLHEKAAIWYQERYLPLPSNCFVDNNPPRPIEETDRSFGSNVLKWSNWYRDKRIKPYGDFHICEKIFCDLENPPVYTDKLLTEWFGYIPGHEIPGN